MVETTASAVRLIARVKSSITDAKLTPFMEAAAFLVDKVCAEYYEADELELFVRWLSAHFYHILDMRRVQERADVISATYMSKVGLGLDVTHYGQQVKILEYLGKLAALEEEIKNPKRKITVSLDWLGKACEDRDPLAT